MISKDDTAIVTALLQYYCEDLFFARDIIEKCNIMFLRS